MKKSLLFLCTRCPSCILLSLLLCIQMGQNDSHAHVLANTSRQDTSGHVTIMILDMSGSMATNDPAALRCSAANAYIDLSNPGDRIGIIGLTNTDPHNLDVAGFPRASVWQSPVTIEIQDQREELKKSIFQHPADAANTSSCPNPSGSTPTYDALALALDMLSKATHTEEGELTGSVILLSDGIPDPDPTGQIQLIRNNLLPRYQQQHWSIDTIALGPVVKDAGIDYHAFLHELANRTGGSYYDDAEGSVAASSPLNITSFFLSIFAQHVNNPQLTMRVPPTDSVGETHSYEFVPDIYTKQLNIVVVKDPMITATLVLPDGTRLSLLDPPRPQMLVVGDKYYEIFSISGPLGIGWHLDINGTGHFQVDSLALSWLQISVIAPGEATLHALGQAITVTAIVDDERNPQNRMSGSGFSLFAVVSYGATRDDATSPVIDRTELQDTHSPGIYQGQIMIPTLAIPGTYNISVSVSQQTDAIISKRIINVHMVHLPIPSLISPETKQATTEIVTVPRSRWGIWLETLYNPTNPILSRLSQPALLYHSIQTPSVVSGIMQIDPNIHATISIINAVLHSSQGAQISIAVKNEGKEHFQLTIPFLPDGTYRLTLTINGELEQNTMPLGMIQLSVRLVSRDVAPWMSIVAWTITSIYLLLSLAGLSLLIQFIVFITRPSPFGEFTLQKNGLTYHYRFDRLQRNPLKTFWRRNKVYSEEIQAQASVEKIPSDLKRMPSGLLIRFRSRHRIEVRRRSQHKGQYWFQIGEGEEKVLSTRYQVIHELTYHPGRGDTIVSPSTYTLLLR